MWIAQNYVWEQQECNELKQEVEALKERVAQLEDVLRTIGVQAEAAAGRSADSRSAAPEPNRVRAASKRAGVSQADLIRRGIRTVTAAYHRPPRPLVGWLKLSPSERKEIIRAAR